MASLGWQGLNNINRLVCEIPIESLDIKYMNFKIRYGNNGI
jgi:hypothetical protein